MPSPFDDQQEHLLSILSQRAGEPVTYDELRDAGLEFPAGLIAELELAGVDVDRCRVAVPGGRSVRAVRLPSPVEPHAGEEIQKASPGLGPASRPLPGPASRPAPERTSPDFGLSPPSQPASSHSPVPSPSSRKFPRREPISHELPPHELPQRELPQRESPPRDYRQHESFSREPSPHDLPERELPPSGSTASGPGWGPVRVYRSSPRPRWARRMRDEPRAASELSP
jgi:hypothetical protein